MATKNTLDDVQTLFLQKAADKAVNDAAKSDPKNGVVGVKIREQVATGNYDFDLLVRMRGAMNVGEDYEKTMPQSVRYKAMFRFLAELAPEELVDKAIVRAYGKDEAPALADIPQQRLNQYLESTTTPVKGSVKIVNLELEIEGEQALAGFE